MKLHYLLLAALPCLPLAVGAAPSSEESITAPETHNRELKVGDKAPDQYKRDDQALKDWKGKPAGTGEGKPLGAHGRSLRAGADHQRCRAGDPASALNLPASGLPLSAGMANIFACQRNQMEHFQSQEVCRKPLRIKDLYRDTPSCKPFADRRCPAHRRLP